MCDATPARWRHILLCPVRQVNSNQHTLLLYDYPYITIVYYTICMVVWCFDGMVKWWWYRYVDGAVSSFLSKLLRPFGHCWSAVQLASSLESLLDRLTDIHLAGHRQATMQLTWLVREETNINIAYEQSSCHYYHLYDTQMLVICVEAHNTTLYLTL